MLLFDICRMDSCENSIIWQYKEYVDCFEAINVNSKIYTKMFFFEEIISIILKSHMETFF